MVNVLETYGRVLRDSRVEDLTVVEAASVRERRFPEWGMCGLVLSSVDRQIIKTLETNGGFHRAHTMPKSALKLLETESVMYLPTLPLEFAMPCGKRFDFEFNNRRTDSSVQLV